MTAIYFMVGVDFSEYSFMHISHYLTEALRKAERNNAFCGSRGRKGKGL